MKKILLFVTLFLLALLTLFSCSAVQNPNKETINEIPEHNINYTHFDFGNVIQDGKQAVFFYFVSDYTVNKIEIAGSLLDKNGNIIHSFDTKMTFNTPSNNPTPAVTIEKDLIKNVKSVTFTKIKAYTVEEFNSVVNL